jgi:hypothetical protein
VALPLTTLPVVEHTTLAVPVLVARCLELFVLTLLCLSYRRKLLYRQKKQRRDQRLRQLKSAASERKVKAPNTAADTLDRDSQPPVSPSKVASPSAAERSGTDSSEEAGSSSGSDSRLSKQRASMPSQSLFESLQVYASYSSSLSLSSVLCPLRVCVCRIATTLVR